MVVSLAILMVFQSSTPVWAWGRLGHLKQLPVVIADIDDAVAYRPGNHLFRGNGSEQVDGRPDPSAGVECAGIESAPVVSPFQNHRYAIVNGLHSLIGIGGENGWVRSSNLAHFAHLNWPNCTSPDGRIPGWTGGIKWNYLR